MKIQNRTHWERLKGVLASLFSGDLASGILMITAVIAALVLANSSWSHKIHELWEYRLTIGLNGSNLSLTLHEIVNEGLMAIFFFTIGLEIKREIIAGELSSLKKAMLPIACAIGGIVLPAFIYIAFNAGHGSIGGWGIPIATDIVFALVILTLVGSKAPMSLKIFITALAVVDDIFAVSVIAFVYTEQIELQSLLWAFLSFFVLLGANRLGVKNPFFYALIGLSGIWTGFFLSGIHATIAGVITAVAIPARVELNEKQFIKNIRNIMDTFENTRPTGTVFMKQNQLELVHILQRNTKRTVPPLQSIETVLQPLVNFIVLPLFAFVNTGLTIDTDNFGKLWHPLSLGIILGLVLGKFLGISIAARLATATNLAKRPENVSWTQLYGAAAFAGIGFTMSIFIGQLAFQDENYQQQAKLAILVAFVLAVLLGLSIFHFFVPSGKEDAAPSQKGRSISN